MTGESNAGTLTRLPSGHALQSLQIISIASEFQDAKTDEVMLAVAFRAIAFYTKDTTRVNAPIRAGEHGKFLDIFQQAVDYGLERMPDFGQPRELLDRRVHLSREALDKIIQDGLLHDPDFMSTSAHRADPSVLSLRNTLIHIEPKYAANVSGLSPNPHAREHLVRSGSTLQVLESSLAPVTDEHDLLFNRGEEAVRAEFWTRQKTPNPKCTRSDTIRTRSAILSTPFAAGATARRRLCITLARRPGPPSPESRRNVHVAESASILAIPGGHVRDNEA